MSLAQKRKNELAPFRTVPARGTSQRKKTSKTPEEFVQTPPAARSIDRPYGSVPKPEGSFRWVGIMVVWAWSRGEKKAIRRGKQNHL